MPFISITRLRLRSARVLPRFALLALRASGQARRAAGFRGGAVLADRQWTFWTATAWDDHDSMRRYMTTGPHRTAMPSLTRWCDEASVVHWTQEDDTLPSWAEAAGRMRRDGRPSTVRHPSPDHAGLTFREPRVTASGPLAPVKHPA